jgi:hypothetical protein
LLYDAEICLCIVLKISYLQAMEGEGKSRGGNTHWTTSQSSFAQTYLANLVSEGKKTSTGFKKVHLNLCAKALNDHFKITRTTDQIGNHLKTLKKVLQS